MIHLVYSGLGAANDLAGHIPRQGEMLEAALLRRTGGRSHALTGHGQAGNLCIELARTGHEQPYTRSLGQHSSPADDLPMHQASGNH